MQNYSDCPAPLSEFLFYMETIKNLSARTVTGYYIDLRLFMRFIKYRRGLVPSDADFESIDISDFTLEMLDSISQMDIYEYLHFVMKDRENNAATRSRKVSSLRSFYKYLTIKSHKIKNDPVKDIEVPALKKSLPKFLSLDESLGLLNAVDGDYKERDYCILTLFLNCGMRLSELVGINDSDISGDTVRLLGKGNKERIVFLNDACMDAVERYRKVRDSKEYTKRDREALFLSRTGSRITARRVEQIVGDNLQKAGLSGRGFSPHKLRHTAATLMYRHGNVDMLALKEILGHEHVSTTEIYTHISEEKLKNAADASPLAKIKAK